MSQEIIGTKYKNFTIKIEKNYKIKLFQQSKINKSSFLSNRNITFRNYRLLKTSKSHVAFILFQNQAMSETKTYFFIEYEILILLPLLVFFFLNFSKYIKFYFDFFYFLPHVSFEEPSTKTELFFQTVAITFIQTIQELSNYSFCQTPPKSNWSIFIISFKVLIYSSFKLNAKGHMVLTSSNLWSHKFQLTASYT